MPCAVDNDMLEEFSKNADSAAFRRRHQLPEDARLIINVGRFTENKRTCDIIDAMRSRRYANKATCTC